jgi:hypothetical protein
MIDENAKKNDMEAKGWDLINCLPSRLNNHKEFLAKFVRNAKERRYELSRNFLKELK